KNGEERPPAPAPGRRGGAAPAEPEKPAVKSVTANQIEPEKPGDLKYRDRRLMALFFDMTSMPIQDQMRARDSALKFLRTQMTRSDLMAIMTFSSAVKGLRHS